MRRPPLASRRSSRSGSPSLRASVFAVDRERGAPGWASEQRGSARAAQVISAWLFRAQADKQSELSLQVILIGSHGRRCGRTNNLQRTLRGLAENKVCLECARCKNPGAADNVISRGNVLQCRSYSIILVSRSFEPQILAMRRCAALCQGAPVLPGLDVILTDIPLYRSFLSSEM